MKPSVVVGLSEEDVNVIDVKILMECIKLAEIKYEKRDGEK